MDSNKRPVLFGTPLSKVLDNETNNDDDRAGPVSRRRARAERQQIVTDDQGRQRFHGAFTGGFSAGHYNSVGTSQGFQPKSFVSKRGDRHDSDGRPAYSHRPEDYMDDEDFGEFGIAPKKVRLASEYSRNSDTREVGLGVGAFILKPKQECVGAKILRSMMGGRGVATDENDIDDLVHKSQKNDLHGLGYKPLSRPETMTTADECQSNPLVATFKHGQRLKISGEAFGSGVLDDDDVIDLHHADEYGLDTMANYEFGSKKSSRQQQKPPKNEQDSFIDHEENTEEYAMDDFVLARDVESLDICGDRSSQYPRPVISADWKMPVRDEPYVPPVDAATMQSIRSFRKQVDQLGEKFVGGSSTATKCDYMEGPSGLLKYSDLKAHQRPTEQYESEPALAAATNSDQSKAIIRRVIEWRPCSLLCRHFNVPNPYPDNAFCGVRPDELTADSSVAKGETQYKSGTGDVRQRYDKVAPIALRKSIFNIGCEEATQDADDEEETDDDEDDEKPQIIELDSDEETKCHSVDRIEAMDSDKESDVVVMLPERQKPEVIDLLSSSSADESNDDEDAYGPPLPPSRRTLEAVGRSTAFARSSSLSSTAGPSDPPKKKNKKRKSKKKRR